MSRRPLRRSSGFTLLEVILATGTAAVLAMALYSSMHIAMKARRSAQDATGPTRETSIVLDLIARDLAAAPRPRGLIAGEFLGSSDGVVFRSFAAPAPEGDLRSMAVVEFAISSVDGSTALVRRVQTNPLATEVRISEELLCREVVEFSLSYFDGDTWRSDWDSTAEGDTLPLAVELSLRLHVSPDVDARQRRAPSMRRIVPLSSAPSPEERAEGGDT